MSRFAQNGGRICLFRQKSCKEVQDARLARAAQIRSRSRSAVIKRPTDCGCNLKLKCIAVWLSRFRVPPLFSSAVQARSHNIIRQLTHFCPFRSLHSQDYHCDVTIKSTLSSDQFIQTLTRYYLILWQGIPTINCYR